MKGIPLKEILGKVKVWARSGAQGVQGMAKRFFISRKITSNNKRIFKNLRWMAVLFLSTGFLAGFTVTHYFIPAPSVKTPGPSWLQKVFGIGMPIVGPAEDGSFIFSDFEQPSSVKAWTALGASIERAERFPSQGAFSLKITYDPKARHSSVVLDNLLKSRQGGSNWFEYEAFYFTLFTPLKQETKIAVKFTDLWGRQYQEVLTFPGGRGLSFRIPVLKIAQIIEASKVDTVSFSAVNLKEPLEIYLDHVGLVREAVPGKTESQPPSNTPGDEGLQGDRPVKVFDYGFGFRKAAWLIRDAQVPGEIVRVPFMIKNETPSPCIRCGVEGSLPFARGELRDPATLRLRNKNGEDLSFQTRVLSRWPEGSIKWLNLVFDTSLMPGEGAGFFLDYGPNIKTLDFSSNLKLAENENEIRVDTGVLLAVIDKRKFHLFKSVYLDVNADKNYTEEEKVSSESFLRLGFKGNEYRADYAESGYSVRIEETGKKRIVLRSEGWLAAQDKSRFSKVIARYYFYENQNTVRVSHTLVYTGFPANPFYFKHEGLSLPENEPIESFGFHLPLALSPEGVKVQFGRMNAAPLTIEPKDSVKALQTGWEDSSAKIGAETLNDAGLLSGWADFSDSSKGVTVFIRNFRENFPKAYGYTAAGAVISVDLWPAETGLLDLSTKKEALGADSAARGSAYGLGKTHEVFLRFHGPLQQSPSDIAGFEERLLIRANPYWIDATGALGRLAAYDKRYSSHERMLENLFDWAARMPKLFRWYGMLDFGDTLTWWRKEKDAKGAEVWGWHPSGRWGWYNAEGPGAHFGALLQFARTGQWKYFDFGENLARHIMDIDTVHFNTIAEDPRLSGVLSDAHSRVGSMHRHNAQHWGGRNEEASHTNIAGLMLYYYLTGDERVLEVAKESGSFYLSERFTFMDHPDMAPHRGLANALWGNVLLFEATGDPRYKEAADKLVMIFLKGQLPDGSFLETYNPQTGKWSGERHEIFMAWYDVPAFIAYHQLTQDEDVKLMLLKLLRYLAPREYAGPAIIHGLAYAYLITHNPEFIEFTELNLSRLFKNAVKDADPMMNGLIYRKPIYHRPNIFLSTAPYAFGALEEHFHLSRKRQ